MNDDGQLVNRNSSDSTQRTLVQCDFDGTVTIEDASFVILDACIPGKWRQLFEEYQEGGMTVGEFNSKAFSMVKADKKSLLDLVSQQVSLREGFRDLVLYCRKKGFRFVIVSNGLDFYIKDILNQAGFGDIEIHASITRFTPEGLSVRHRGPDGNILDRDVKTAYTEHFLKQGYRVVYLGDGKSDVQPAARCRHIFATGSLVEHCRNEKLDCTPFESFHEVVREMESWN